MTQQESNTGTSGVAQLPALQHISSIPHTGPGAYGLTFAEPLTADQLTSAIVAITSLMPKATLQFTPGSTEGGSPVWDWLGIILRHTDERYEGLRALKGAFTVQTPLTAEGTLNDGLVDTFDAQIKVLDCWNADDHVETLNALVEKLRGTDGIIAVKRTGTGIVLQAQGSVEEKYTWLYDTLEAAGVAATLVRSGHMYSVLKALFL